MEHYLTAVLPFGGRHADGHQNLLSQVPRRLERNKRLHKHLAKRIGKIWHEENGVYRKSMILPVDYHKIVELFKYIARGLLWHHWHVVLSEADTAMAFMLNSHGTQYFEQLLGMRAANRVVEDIGNGTFVYSGVQGLEIKQISVWRFRLYGGIIFGGDPEAPDEFCTEIGVLTGPKDDMDVQS